MKPSPRVANGISGLGGQQQKPSPLRKDIITTSSSTTNNQNNTIKFTNIIGNSSKGFGVVSTKEINLGTSGNIGASNKQ